MLSVLILGGCQEKDQKTQYYDSPYNHFFGQNTTHDFPQQKRISSIHDDR